MAILGTGGILELSREWPDSMIVASSTLNFVNNTINVSNENFWTGDRVLVIAEDGVPVDVNNDGYADSPENHGFYFGSIYNLGPSKDHISSSDDNFYTASNSSAFYNTAATTGLSKTFNGYVHVDDLGRFSFYSSRQGAYNKNSDDSIDFLQVKITNNLIVAQYNSTQSYIDAYINHAIALKDTQLPDTSLPLRSVTTLSGDITSVNEDPDKRGWLIQCDLVDWVLNIDSSVINTDAISEKFGESVKAIVRGTGSLNFIYENRISENEQSSSNLLRLALLTQEASKASAKFYIYKDRANEGGNVTGSAYYECDILLSGSNINIRATDLIVGTADFVTTGSVELRFEL